MGYRGSKKNTPYAAQLASQDAGKVAFDAGMKKADVMKPNISVNTNAPVSHNTTLTAARIQELRDDINSVEDSTKPV